MNQPSPHAQQLHRAALSAAQAGRLDEALDLMRKSLALAPDVAGFHANAGVLCRMLGRHDEALEHWSRAATLDPNDADAHINLAAAHCDRRDAAQALDHATRAIQLAPQRVESHINLATALMLQKRWTDAIDALSGALSRFPGHPQLLAHLARAWNNLASALMFRGQPEAGAAAFRKAFEMDPTFARAHSNLLYSMHFDPAFDAAAILAAHRDWDRIHGSPLRAAWRPHNNDRSPDRRLRIAYLSPDFREHPVGRAMQPLLDHHDADQFEVVCYSDTSTPDDRTATLKNRAHVWHDTTSEDDACLADRIRDDGIDILIDLTQHMGANRMPAVARKPAPLQVAFLGYPATTGVAAVDYRITDSILDPPGETEPFNSEQLVRLPQCFWCYRGEDVPVAPPPAQRNGFITFGSLNSAFKTSAATLALWSDVLTAIPTSRLLVAAPVSEPQQFLARYAEHRIDPARVDLLQRVPLHEYLRGYDRIDIALDTFPYNGGVTTCDAMWMGVPVVTMRGATSVARAGESILTSMDLPQWLAPSRNDFIAIATSLASEPSQLPALRQQLRQRMLDSPICDEIGFTRAVESAYRQMWRKWCTAR